MQYFLYRMVILIIHCLGRKRAYAFARFCSDRRFYAATKDRQSVINNLQQIMKTKADVTLQAREVFRNFARYLVDFFFMYRMVDDRFLQEDVIFEGRENLHAAAARGKGIILLTAHLGNWEMGAAILNRCGYSVTAIALPHKDRRVNELFNRQRTNHGVTVVPTSAAVRRCIEALRQNKCVAVLGDRDFGSFGEPLPFLGRPTLIPKGAAFFSRRTGAAILPVFCIPQVNGQYKFVVEEAIIPEDSSLDGCQQELALMKKYVAVIERKVRENPLQWLMFREFGIEYEDLSSHSRVQRGAGARAAC